MTFPSCGGVAHSAGVVVVARAGVNRKRLKSVAGTGCCRFFYRTGVSISDFRPPLAACTMPLRLASGVRGLMPQAGDNTATP